MSNKYILSPINLLPLALAACGSPNDPGAGGVTRSEAEALNGAAAMLDANSANLATPEAGRARQAR